MHFILIIVSCVRDGYSAELPSCSKGKLLSLTTVNDSAFIKLLKFISIHGHDIWKVNHNSKKLLVKVDNQDQINELKSSSFIRMHDVDITTIIDDLTEYLQSIQKPPSKRNRRSTENNDLESLIGDDYLSFNDFIRCIRQMKMQYKKFVKLKRVGRSWNNNSLIVIKIESPLPREKPRRVIWIDAGIHGREWISPSSVLYFTWMLLNRSAMHNNDVFQIMRDFCFYIMPFVNPDGYTITFANKDNILRFWRKNARPSNHICSGVDLNRNFPFAWNETNSGASTNPCSEVYKGPEAQSEPEVKAITNFISVMQRRMEFAAFLTFHSYGQYWFYPWGYTKSVKLVDEDELKSLAQIATSAMTTDMFDDWKIGQSSHLMYLSSGTSEDWAKAVAEIKYTYCIELPPGDESINGFVLPKEYIRPVGNIVFSGVINLLKEVIRRK